MDLHNNELGRDLGADLKPFTDSLALGTSCFLLCQKAYDEHKLSILPEERWID